MFQSLGVRADKPGNLDDCLAIRVENVNSDVAAAIGRQSCLNQFPRIPTGSYALQCGDASFWIDEDSENVRVATESNEEPVEATVRAFLVAREELLLAIDVNGQGLHLKFDKSLGTLSSPDEAWVRFSECHVVEP